MFRRTIFENSKKSVLSLTLLWQQSGWTVQRQPKCHTLSLQVASSQLATRRKLEERRIKEIREEEAMKEALQESGIALCFHLQFAAESMAILQTRKLMMISCIRLRRVQFACLTCWITKFRDKSASLTLHWSTVWHSAACKAQAPNKEVKFRVMQVPCIAASVLSSYCLHLNSWSSMFVTDSPVNICSWHSRWSGAVDRWTWNLMSWLRSIWHFAECEIYRPSECWM